jgi:hypothetical protein
MPPVIEAIRASGRPYSASSHEDGYAMPVFDLERDTPRHGRGSYLRTENVMALDLSSLDLDTVKTTKWGLER